MVYAQTFEDLHDWLHEENSPSVLLRADRGWGETPCDVRLNNVSRLAGFAKKEDLRYFAKAIRGIDYSHVPALAPTEEILDAYKKRKGDWSLYERQFLELIRSRQIERIVSGTR